MRSAKERRVTLVRNAKYVFLYDATSMLHKSSTMITKLPSTAIWASQMLQKPWENYVKEV